MRFDIEENEKIEFIKIWQSINFKEMFNEEQYNEFQKMIILHITHISFFHLIFELFGDFNENMSNYKNIILFKNKYISLIQLVSNEYLNNLNDTFIEDSANLIYILAFDKTYVNHALKEWNLDEQYTHSEEFIDKIIQVPLTIPKYIFQASF